MRLSLPFSPLCGALAIACWLAAAGGVAAQEAEGDPAPVLVHLDDASLPDFAKSPGDFSRDVSAADLCDTPIEEFALTPPKTLCDDVFEESRVSAAYRFQYSCVFLVPPAIGGTQSRTNLWLQPAAEASLKRTADEAARKHVCRNQADLTNTQQLMANNWVSAYRKYLLPGDRLAPIVRHDRAPDDFGHAPPAPPEEGFADASFGGGGVPYGSDLGQGYDKGGGQAYGGGQGYGDGAGPNDRRRRRGALQDDRRRTDGRGIAGRGTTGRNDDFGRTDDRRGRWPQDRDQRDRNGAGRGPNWRDGAGPRPGMPRNGARPGDEHAGDRRPGDERADDARRHDRARRGFDGRDDIGRHPDLPRDGARHDDGRFGDGRPEDRRPDDRRADDGRRGMHPEDGPGEHRDGRDDGPHRADRGDDRHRDGPREADRHRPFHDERGAGWPHRDRAFPSQRPDWRGVGPNHPFENADRRFPPSRYADAPNVRPTYTRPNDVRPNDVRPNSVRPNYIRPSNVRPTNVRPSRPGLGRPFFPGGMRHAGGRGGGRRR